MMATHFDQSKNDKTWRGPGYYAVYTGWGDYEMFDLIQWLDNESQIKEYFMPNPDFYFLGSAPPDRFVALARDAWAGPGDYVFAIDRGSMTVHYYAPAPSVDVLAEGLYIAFATDDKIKVWREDVVNPIQHVPEYHCISFPEKLHEFMEFG